MKKTFDEENFEEAEAQAYRLLLDEDRWLLLKSPMIRASTLLSAILPSRCCFALVHQKSTHALPLSSTLPDMKSSTAYYIELQKLYKKHAEEEKEILKSYMKVPGTKDDFFELFVKEFAWNQNAEREVSGGELDAEPQASSFSWV